ncbi:hypothetical protein [Nitratifractor sp.]
MIYLYAYSNHRSDLDALRRVGALWKALDARRVPAEILVNDYRAQLAGRESGLPPATTIETVMDIDAVAAYGDVVLIDSPETLPDERLAHYTSHFSKLFLVSPCGGQSRFSERILDPWDPQKGPIVSVEYEAASSSTKSGRVLIYGDSDYDKRLLHSAEVFDGLGLELYWGSYFYVKYEEELLRHFSGLRESEEYVDVIRHSETIVTAMPQTAAEAAAAGARTIWLDRGTEPSCVAEALGSYGIRRLPWDELDTLGQILDDCPPDRLFASSLERWTEALLD